MVGSSSSKQTAPTQHGKDFQPREVKFDVGGKLYSIQQGVLEQIPYFSAMLRSGMIETTGKCVQLQVPSIGSVTREDLKVYMDLLSGEYTLNVTNAHNALIAAEYFLDLDLQQTQCPELFVQKFDDLAVSNTLLNLSYDQVSDLLSAPELTVYNEFTIFKAVYKWIAHNQKDRIQHLPTLLAKLSKKALNLNNTFAFSRTCAREELKSLKNKNFLSLLSPNESKRNYYGGIYTVTGDGIVYNGQCIGDTPKVVESTSLPDSAAVINCLSKVYILGGQEKVNNKVKVTGDVYCFDSARKTLEKSAEMLTPRVNPAVCTHNGQLLVFGGFTNTPDGVLETLSCEMYNPQTNTWKEITNIQVEDGTAWKFATSCEDGVLVTSLNKTSQQYNTYLYKPDTNIWKKINHVNSSDLSSQATFSRGKFLYFIDDRGYTRRYNYLKKNKKVQKLNLLGNLKIYGSAMELYHTPHIPICQDYLIFPLKQNGGYHIQKFLVVHFDSIERKYQDFKFDILSVSQNFMCPWRELPDKILGVVAL